MVVNKQLEEQGDRPGHVVRGREVICQLLGGIGNRSFYKLVRQGLPVKKIGPHWTGIDVDILQWFSEFLST